MAGAGAKLVDIGQPELHRTIGVLQRPDTALPPVLGALIERLVDLVSTAQGIVPVGR